MRVLSCTRARAPSTYVRKHSGRSVALPTSLRHRSRVRRRHTRGAMADCRYEHSAACRGGEPPGNHATKTRPAQLQPLAEGSAANRFRIHPQPQPMAARELSPMGAGGGRSGRGRKPKIAIGQLDELSPNFLFHISEGPTGGVASSF